MSEKTLFLAWQDTKESRLWFPVGRLDVDVGRSDYRFRYTVGAKQAKEEAGFQPLIEFPSFEEPYSSHELFPLFQNRVMDPRRPDFTDYLHNLDLHEGADPIEILSANGGLRATDTYEVFPKPVKEADGSFTCRFFLHGWRHVNPSAQERISCLEPGEKLYLTLELTNPATRLAAQIQTTDYYMVGWAPRYLVDDLVTAMVESPGQYEAEVVRINSLPAPSKQRVLIEMRGHWNKHEPMADEKFEPLVD